MSSNPQQTLESTSSLVEPVVQASGHHLYDVQHNGGTLTVLVESQKALGVDELSELSRVLSNALDDDDPIPGRYTLEVSTPESSVDCVVLAISRERLARQSISGLPQEQMVAVV